MEPLIIGVIIAALVFDFVNGFHDSANAIATVVGTRVLSPVQAVSMAAFFNLIGPFVLGVAVATTVGKGIVDTNAVTVTLVLAALIGAIVWDLITWWWGLPTSSSHALVGGLIGAAVAAAGWGPVFLPVASEFTGLVPLVLAGAIGTVGGYVGLALYTKDVLRLRTGLLAAAFGGLLGVPIALLWGGVKMGGVTKTVVFMVVSPVLGLAAGFVLCILVIRLASPIHSEKANSLFKRLQLISSAFFALNHGANDAQKVMGIIAVLLFASGDIDHFYVPDWVILSCAGAIALGTLFGGWRIVKTMATRITHLRPYQGFAAETGGGVVLTLMAAQGIPVSTTHAISASIMGVGATHRLSAVRWGVGRRIVGAWILTIPAAAFISFVSYVIVNAAGIA